MVNNETKWLVRALVTLAKRILKETNDNRENADDWPAGQEWSDLSHTSQHTFLRRALADSGIPIDEYQSMINAAMDGGDDGELDELWHQMESKN